MCKYSWHSEFSDSKALLMNFPSVFKEFSIPCWKILRRFPTLLFLLHRSTSYFLLFSNLLSREQVLRMLDFALISFLLFSTDLSCK